MRIVTWNINGLRACLKRRFDGKLVNLLNFLEADIICFQETKLARHEATEDLALADGWESFFAYCRTRGGYSGVATFCRTGVAVPLAALDGFSGVLTQGPGKAKDVPPSTAAQDVLSAPCVTLFDSFSQEELERLDSEGRVVMTDHGAFVLVNVYGPAISTEESAEERYAFKLRFYEGLLHRIQALRAAGRCIVLLGDLNISLAPIDSCDPGPIDAFVSRSDRRLLTRLLTANGGPFLDVFRKFHPDRREAYTCWSTASGARINNYGTRIDLILAAGPDGAAASADFHGLFTAADVWMDAQGSDHAPAWAELAPHARVLVGEVPPPLSSRYLFTGKQGNLRSWLSKSAPASQGCSASQPLQSLQRSESFREAARQPPPGLGKRAAGRAAQKGGSKAAKLQAGPGQSNLRAFMKPQAAQKSAQAASVGSEQNQNPDGSEAGGMSTAAAAAASGPSKEGRAEGVSGGDEYLAEAAANWDGGVEGNGDAGAPSDQNTAAKAVWKQIQDRMKPPLCKGHGEPCVIRQVKKGGANQGRVFYVCRRAAGNPPVGRCDHFAWAGNREMRGTGAQKGAAAMTLKQAWN
ncbi:hypothetical protein WJX75_005948 [Coccomyxa subellipsoidea]|uniref:DNA-(apurinic or apyrimidinic site) endonuclease 2 n=1 Tax=Coccomyxa subellipsoidea TaxID=248742 RepID=A0ABR2YB77_9CHLO